MILALVAQKSVEVGYDLGVDKLKCDETKQRLKLKLGEEILASQSTNAPHVFLVLRKLLWSKGDLDMTYEHGFPPVPCLTTTAGTLHAIFHKLPGLGSSQQYNRVLDTMSANCEDLLKLRTMDGAKSNNKYTAWEIMNDANLSSVFLVAMHCLLHVNSLIGSALTVALFPLFPEALYCASKFLRMGDFFLRMMYSAPELVKGFTISIEPPDAKWPRIHKAFILLVSLLHKGSTVYTAYVGPKATWWTDLLFLISVLNGNWLSATLIHHCRGCSLPPQ